MKSCSLSMASCLPFPPAINLQPVTDVTVSVCLPLASLSPSLPPYRTHRAKEIQRWKSVYEDYENGQIISDEKILLLFFLKQNLPKKHFMLLNDAPYFVKERGGGVLKDCSCPIKSHKIIYLYRYIYNIFGLFCKVVAVFF